MKKDLVDDVHSDMMSVPLNNSPRDSVRAEYPFRKTKTSDFFDGNIRTFEAKHPYFCLKKSDVFDFRNAAWGTNIQDVCFEDDNDAMEVMDAGGKSTGSVESFYR